MTNKDPILTQYPWYVRLIFYFQKKKYGYVLNSSLIWAKSPKIFLALSRLYSSIDRKYSPISPILRSLIIVRVSQINGCAFCIDLNISVLVKRGVDLNKVQSLPNWPTSTLFDEQEKLVLEYTEAVTDSTQKLSAPLKQRMNEHFTQKELVEITALVAFQNMSTKFNNAFDIEPQGFCSIPK
ncbi:MAG: carboxymuconolactone decarboxylase family protein [Alphaproteobacteria bacterium]|nr:carboxymuconolactone decarboxylase family protein [Alphaproteobacteria bacterium]